MLIFKANITVSWSGSWLVLHGKKRLNSRS